VTFDIEYEYIRVPVNKAIVDFKNQYHVDYYLFISTDGTVGISSYADVARRAGEMKVSQSNKEHVRVIKKM
jgi:hypothetical protein